jgi:hypothetical protein
LTKNCYKYSCKNYLSQLFLIGFILTQTSALNAKNKHLASDSEVKVFIDRDVADGTNHTIIKKPNYFYIQSIIHLNQNHQTLGQVI